MLSASVDRRALIGGAATLAFSAALTNAARAETPALRIDLSFGPRVPPEMQARLQVWADTLKGKVALWWPTIVTSLNSPGYTPPEQLSLSFFRIDNPNVPAFTTAGPRINVDPWKLIARLNNPDTFGMVAHELVHVAQAYPAGAAPSWITEGIADYMRYYVLLPADSGRFFDPRGLTEKTGYQPTAGLLDWVEKSHPGAVARINLAMREGRDGEAALARVGGGDPDALWRAYIATYPAAANAEAAARRAVEIQSQSS